MVYPQIDLNADYCIDDDKKISGKEIDKKVEGSLGACLLNNRVGRHV